MSWTELMIGSVIYLHGMAYQSHPGLLIFQHWFGWWLGAHQQVLRGLMLQYWTLVLQNGRSCLWLQIYFLRFIWYYTKSCGSKMSQQHVKWNVLFHYDSYSMGAICQDVVVQSHFFNTRDLGFLTMIIFVLQFCTSLWCFCPSTRF